MEASTSEWFTTERGTASGAVESRQWTTLERKVVTTDEEGARELGRLYLEEVARFSHGLVRPRARRLHAAAGRRHETTIAPSRAVHGTRGACPSRRRPTVLRARSWRRVIGRALVPELARGCDVVAVSRRAQPGDGGVEQASADVTDAASLEGLIREGDVVHLVHSLGPGDFEAGDRLAADNVAAAAGRAGVRQLVRRRRPQRADGRRLAASGLPEAAHCFLMVDDRARVGLRAQAS